MHTAAAYGHVALVVIASALHVERAPCALCCEQVLAQRVYRWDVYLVENGVSELLKRERFKRVQLPRLVQQRRFIRNADGALMDGRLSLSGLWPTALRLRSMWTWPVLALLRDPKEFRHHRASTYWRRAVPRHSGILWWKDLCQNS